MAEPERIEVDHILIGVTSPKFAGKRAAADAKKVAYDLLAKLKAGGDWAKTKREYSEDPPPGGPYALSNRGVKPGKGEYAREMMVPAFGNVGFVLTVGEIGVADHDARTSPFGYHLIKRTK
jgi:parvulin-like peptidyl-prolyl isomerase